jgi:type VI secretion system protein ImpK
MYWACSDLLTLASQLGSGASLPSASEMRNRIGQLFGAMHTRARAAGIAPEDAGDAAYAIMALLDEILVQASWLGRTEWQVQPLQFIHFQENTAGENFFRRAEVLLRQPHRAHVLLVYFLCLGLGFQGRYAMGGGAGLAPVYETIGHAVAFHMPPADVASPRGEPPDLARNLLQQEAPIVRIALGMFLAALLVFGGLRLWLSSQVSSATNTMHTAASSTKP